MTTTSANTDQPHLTRLHIQEAVELRYTLRHRIRDQVLEELASSRAKNWIYKWNFETSATESPSKALSNEYVFWEPIDSIVNLADDAVTRSGESEEKFLDRWDQQPPSRLNVPDKTTNDDSASLDYLSDCAYAYLRESWADSPTLERWLVRKMIYAEAFSFAREMGLPVTWRSRRVWWTWTKSLVKWVIGVAVALSIGDAHGLAYGVLAYFAWTAMTHLTLKWQVEQLEKPTKLFTVLQHPYKLSMHPATSPLELGDSLSAAENEGVVWPVGLAAIVDRAKNRCRWSWSQQQGEQRRT